MGKPKAYYDLLKFSALGLEMGAAVVIGLLFGIFLDSRFGTSPWLTLLFLGFGFAAAVKAVLKAVSSEILKDDDEPQQ